MSVRTASLILYGAGDFRVIAIASVYPDPSAVSLYCVIGV